MANFCLPPYLVDDFKKRLKSGEISPDKLLDMTSTQRRKYFTSFLGEDNARFVNAEFESKILLKNQQTGLINWAKQLTGIKPLADRSFIKKVQGMTEILQPKDIDTFLSDLVAQRLGLGVTMEEANKIADLAATVADKKALVPDDSPIGSKERLEYGLALVKFKEYVGDLKLGAKRSAPKGIFEHGLGAIEMVAGTMKSILASMDNSFFGRQGFVTLVAEPDIWMKNFAKSWGDIGKELAGIDAMTMIKADIFSRPNAINGKYRAMKLDVGLDTEEAFPSALPAKIPLLGRLYKASESAYNGAALRFRADLADRYIDQAETMGVNVRDKNTGLGLLINSMTGRGSTGRWLTPDSARMVNVLLFSVKYLKSNIDVLTAHLIDRKSMHPFVFKKAVNNLLRVVGVIAATLAIAKLLDPDSVEEDPRSTDFGKIKVGDKHEIKINISGGFGGLITLISRIGSKKIKTAKGKLRKVDTGEYGAPSSIGLIVDFMEGKASPIARLAQDLARGKTFEGEKVTVANEAANVGVPIPMQNFFDLAKSSAGADPLLFFILMALDELGLNVNVKKKRKK